MKDLICWLIGHDWEFNICDNGGGMFICLRCNEIHYT